MQDSWQAHVRQALSELTSLLPWADLAEIRSNSLTPNAAATQLRITLWRLRGVRDGADLLCARSTSEPERARAAELSIHATRAFGVCAETLRLMSRYDAGMTADLPTATWVTEKPKKLNGHARPSRR